MRTQAAVWICVMSALFAAPTLAGESEVPTRPFIQRLKPVGGWAPYEGGLLRWWPQHCFPNCGTPGDYCRKTLPKVCWPPYPGYFTSGPPEVCYPCCSRAGCSCAGAR